MISRKVILNKIKHKVYKTDPKAEIILFGSRARGDFEQLSDWDILILLNSKEIPFKMETDLIDDIYDVELETGEVISPLIYSKSEWNSLHKITPFFKVIEKEGVYVK
jgi:predicted nucleotidyltransferase